MGLRQKQGCFGEKTLQNVAFGGLLRIAASQNASQGAITKGTEEYSLVKKRSGAVGREIKLAPHLYGALTLGMRCEIRIYWVFRRFGVGKQNMQIFWGVIWAAGAGR